VGKKYKTTELGGRQNFVRIIFFINFLFFINKQLYDKNIRGCLILTIIPK